MIFLINLTSPVEIFRIYKKYGYFCKEIESILFETSIKGPSNDGYFLNLYTNIVRFY